MSEKEPEENRIDTVTAQFLDNFAQRVSRRGVLARLGKLCLGALGVSLLPNLPLDRSFIANAQNPDCSTDKRLCGIWGYICNQDCCGHSGTFTSCPGCLVEGGYAWECCCPNADGCGATTWAYADCCGADDGNCRGPWCGRNPTGEQPAWCLDGHPYICTVAHSLGACNLATADCKPA